MLTAGSYHHDACRPLYTDSEDKLGHALRTATPASCGGTTIEFDGDRMYVGGVEVKIYTKTGRLVRRRIRGASEGDLGWRPGPPQEEPGSGSSQPIPKRERGITDDFSANGAFLSYSESRARLIGHDADGYPHSQHTPARVDTLRMHDADTAGGPGIRQASLMLDQALLPAGMLAGLRAMRADGTIENVSLGMNAHRKHMGRWQPSVITDL